MRRQRPSKSPAQPPRRQEMARDEGNSGRSVEHKNMEHRESFTGARHLSARGPVSGSMLTTGALIGMAVGAGIAMASNWLPDLVGGTIRPLVKTAIKASYAAATMAREVLSEASESVSDMVAEAR